MMQPPDANTPGLQPPPPFEDLPGASIDAGLQAAGHQYLLQAQKGRLYPEHIPVNAMQRVLDIGCTTGDWVFDLARHFPQLHIFGIDKSEETVRVAKTRRQTSHLPRIEFRTLDYAQPLPIADNFFDFIHVRNGSIMIQAQQWPSLISECVRILNPGGWITLVEMEFGEISSPSYMRLQHIITQATRKTGHSFDSSEIVRGPAGYLYGMLLQAQLEEVSYNLDIIDLGFMGGNIGQVFLAGFLRQVSMLIPFIQQLGMYSKVELEKLVMQTQQELQAPDLCGWMIVLSAYGKRATT